MTPSPLSALVGRALSTAPVEHDDDPLGRLILDATIEVAAASGIRSLAVEDVANLAGTTRMTVYRRFGRREQLIEAMAVRETRRFIAALSAAIAPVAAIEDQAAEAFVVGLRFMHGHPVARRAIESEPEAIVQYLETEDGLLFVISREFIAERLRAASVPRTDITAAAEAVLRLFVSFLLLPRSSIELDDDEATRAFVRTFMAPLVTAGGTRSRAA